MKQTTIFKYCCSCLIPLWLITNTAGANSPESVTKANIAGDLLQRYQQQQMSEADFSFITSGLNNNQSPVTTTKPAKSAKPDIYVGKVIADRSYANLISLKAGERIDVAQLDQLVENLKTELTEPKILLIPTDNPKIYNIRIELIRKRSLLGYVGIDNTGTGNVGRNNIYANVSRDNILATGDFLTVRTGTSLNNTWHQRYNNNWGINYSVPVKSWKFIVDYMHYSEQEPLAPHLNYRKLQNNYRVEVVKNLVRDGHHKWDGYVQLNKIAPTVKIAGEKIRVQSLSSSNIQLGGRGLYYLSDSVLFIQPSVEFGVPWWGATGDLVNSLYKREYQKYNLYMYYHKNLAKAHDGLVTYTTNFLASYSPDMLLFSNAFEFGGLNSVRGIKNERYKGQYGAYWQNTWSLQRQHLTPFIGLDGGWAQRRLPLPNTTIMQRQWALSGATGLNYRNNDFNIKLTLAHLLWHNRQVSNESLPVYIEANYVF